MKPSLALMIKYQDNVTFQIENWITKDLVHSPLCNQKKGARKNFLKNIITTL